MNTYVKFEFNEKSLQTKNDSERRLSVVCQLIKLYKYNLHGITLYIYIASNLFYYLSNTIYILYKSKWLNYFFQKHWIYYVINYWIIIPNMIYFILIIIICILLLTFEFWVNNIYQLVVEYDMSRKYFIINLNI